MSEDFNNDLENLKWTEISREKILETPVFNVMKTTSISPEGQKGNYFVTEANDWVITIPVLGEDFLMVKQWRHGEKNISIEFPGGVIEKCEKPEDGAKRELKEETGFKAKKLIHLGTLNPNPALMANHVHIYAAYELENTGKLDLDNDEFLNVLKMKQSEVIDKFGSEEFQHGLMGLAVGLFLRKMIKSK